MNCLLTGASGFIGAHIKNEIDANSEINLTCLNRSLIDPKTDKVFDLILDDFKSLPKSDVIIHSAQTRHYKNFKKMAEDVFRVNVESTFKLLEQSVKNSTGHFLLISSGSVYENQNGPLLETNSLSPSSPNGTTKYMAEQLTKLYEDRIDICIFRIFFPYGPGQKNQLVPNLIHAIRNNTPIELCDENGLTFSPTFVGDIARLIVKACKEKWIGTFNISGPKQTSLRDFCDLIGEQLDIIPQYTIKHYEHQNIAANTEKLQKYCRNFCWTSFETGIQKTLKDLTQVPNEKENKKNQ